MPGFLFLFYYFYFFFVAIIKLAIHKRRQQGQAPGGKGGRVLGGTSQFDVCFAAIQVAHATCTASLAGAG